MEKIIRYLVLLLVVQLGLALVLGRSSPDLTANQSDTPLVVFKKEAIDGIKIVGEEQAGIVLLKKADKWLFPEKWEFPADRDKVEKLLTTLQGLKRGLPVATTTGAVKRFKVADDTFERKIVLLAGKEVVATLYFGDSPGIRQIHARIDGSEPIFSVEFSAHDASVKIGDWLDTEILRIPEGEIEKMEVAGLVITRIKQEKAKESAAADAAAVKPASWQVGNLAGGESLDQGKVDKLVRQIANLSVNDLLGLEDNEAFNLKKPGLTLTVVRQGGGKVDYAMSKHQKEDFFVVKTSQRKEFFKLPKHSGEPILELAKREALIVGTAKSGEGPKVVAPELKPADSETKVVTTPESKLAGPGTQAAAPESKSAAPGAKPVAPESKSVAPETQSVAPESKSVAPETQLVAPESKSVAPETKAPSVAPETKVVAPGAVSSEPKVVLQEGGK